MFYLVNGWSMTSVCTKSAQLIKAGWAVLKSEHFLGKHFLWLKSGVMMISFFYRSYVKDVKCRKCLFWIQCMLHCILSLYKSLHVFLSTVKVFGCASRFLVSEIFVSFWAAWCEWSEGHWGVSAKWLTEGPCKHRQAGCHSPQFSNWVFSTT